MAAVYTRTGDKGTTALFGGSRVPKQSIRVSAYGSVDEANAFIGAAKCQMEDDELRDFVHKVGHRLFVLGSELASDVKGRARLIGLVNDSDITEMEALIDKCMAFCGPQRAFIVPGTEPISASLHIARTAVRRAERMVLTLGETEDVRPEAIKYLNRLSDALYAIARVYEVRHDLAKIEGEVRAKVAGTTSTDEEKKASMSANHVVDLDLARCRLAADTATRLARARGVAITFAAVDPSGVLLFLQRDDDARFVSVQIAQDKAYTAASMRMPSADLGPYLADGGDFQGLHTSHDGRITAIGGGVPVFLDGRFVGGIAVSGGAREDDIELVAKALEAIGGTTS